MSKYKTIHIDKERLEILLEKADPGDFFNITVYPIPHRSSLPHLVEVIERAALDEAKDYIERLIYSYYNPNEMDFDAVVLNAEKFLREVENEST